MKEIEIRFESFEMKPSGFVRVSNILRHMQQVARDDLFEHGISYQDLRDRNMAFVVSRMSLRFLRPVPGEVPLRLFTAPGEVRGATFPRYFTLSDEKGLLMVATSQWALLDFEKRCLLRPNALPAPIPGEEDPTGGFSCERLARPKDAFPTACDERRVYLSLLDQNEHLNNCHYADLALDLYPDITCEVREMHINFRKEVRLGELILLEGFEEGESRLVCGTVGEGEEVSFLCKIDYFEDEHV